MAKNKQYAAEAEARGGSSSQDEGEEESESASESECEEKEVENEEQEHDEDQDEGEEGSSSESESECEEKQVEKEEQDEGEEGSASESESECEEKDENTIPAPLPKKPSSGSAAQHPQSSSSSSSESDSSPVNHCGVDPNMKMMQSSAAASASAKNKKPTSKKPICNPTLKRLVESESENRKSKRAKAVKGKGKVNVNADGVEDRLNKTSASKKVFFQRLWSAEDEIVILQGIIKYTATTGLDPSANINAFYLSIKNFIHVHVTKTQLCDKIRKLKQKYMTNATKAKLPSNSHDQQLYNLSQKIWGFQTNAVKLDTTNNNKDVVHGKPTLKEDVSNKMAEIERELKKLQISQLELLRSTQLICEQTKRVLESLQ